MATLEEEQLNANLDILLQLELAKMDPADRDDLELAIEGIRDEYRLAAEKGKTSKYYKDLSESIAKSLPQLVKGAFAAAAAFEKGDVMTGTAALMDICTSVIPVLSSVFSAGGPPGALIGAIFSVVGQILSFFAPQQPSLKTEIAKMLAQLQSETALQNIEAFGLSVSSYTDSITEKCRGVHKMEPPVSLTGTVSLTPGSNRITGTATTFTKTTEVGQWLMFGSDTKLYKIGEIASDTSLTVARAYDGAPMAASALKLLQRTTTVRSIADILEMPLETESQADAFREAMEQLLLGLVTEQGKIINVPVFANWQVATYLTRDKNQSKEGWPEVLGVWCRTYTDLLSANVTLSCLADPKTLDRRRIETQKSNKNSPLDEDTRGVCHGLLINLKSLQGHFRELWKADKRQMLKIVKEITPVARERGVYVHLGHWAGGNIVYVASGNGSAAPLQWDYKKNTKWLRSMSIHVPKAQQKSFVPKYELLALQETTVAEKGQVGTQIWRHTLDSVSGALSDGTEAIKIRPGRGEDFFDVSGTAFNEKTIGMDDSTHPVTLVALAIEERGPAHYLNLYTLDKDGKGTRVNYEPRMAGAKDIRCLYLPPTTLPDDPDADAMTDANATPPGPPLVSQKTAVIYGGVRNANHLWVLAWNSWETVIGPDHWTTYNGIEIDPYYVWLFGKGGIACATHASMIKCRQGKRKQPAWIYHDFDKQQFPTPPEVISLSPCADGTLFVMLSEIYTADYKIDRQKNRVLTSSWVKRGGQAKQVIKMPIPCWSALEKLKANLQADV